MKLLYVCTHNRCRSILSEAVTRGRAGSLIDVRSAGSQPVGEVHPLSLKYLQQTGYDIDGLVSESWNAYVEWAPDVVITVCDRAAGETCPLYLGSAIKLHWGLQDPSALRGTEEQIAAAFLSTITCIEQRVDQLNTVAQLPATYWQSALFSTVPYECSD
jgi:arsenate reductase